MKRVYLVLFLLLCLLVQGQESAPIQAISPLAYDGENQNWSIEEGENGYLYFANNHSILSFDGERWSKYGTPNGSVIRSLAFDGKRLYAGCYMEFGYWERNEQGTLVYSSLSKLLEVSLLEDEEFWNIQVVDDLVLFQSFSRILLFNSDKESIEEIPAEVNRAAIFELADGLYYQVKNKGLYVWNKSGSKLLIPENVIGKQAVVSFTEKDGNKQAILDNGERVVFGPDGTAKGLENPFSFLGPVSIYCSYRLKDGGILLGTIANGLLQLNSQGHFVKQISIKQGLQDNTVLSLTEDSKGNIWVGHDKGISIINRNSFFKEYIDKEGEIGVVYTSMWFKNQLYLGTNQGLYVAENAVKGSIDFRLIPNTEGQVWSLQVLQDQLFCGHHKGTFLITDSTAKQVASIPGTWLVKAIPENEDVLIQGNYTGLAILRKVNGEWSFERKLDGFDISSRFLAFVNPKTLWVNHEYKGVFKLQLDAALTNVTQLYHQEQMGYGSSIFKFDSQLRYATNNGVFTITNAPEPFVLDTTLTRIFQETKNTNLSIVLEDEQKERIWRLGDQSIMYVEPGKINNEYKLQTIPIATTLRKNLGVSGFENIKSTKKNEYLLGTSNGYVVLDLAAVKPVEYKINFKSAWREYFDANANPLALDSTIIVPYKDNKLRFAYTVPNYDKYTEVFYQYKLENFHTDWSKWTNESQVSFENLPFGTYTLQVRAKVGDTLTENTLQIPFVIQRPWYWSYVAMVCYFFTLLILGTFIHRTYRGYYKKQQEKLLKQNALEEKRKKNKAKRKLVQLTNEKLKQEIDAKNRELAVATMSMIKKNEFLNVLKNRLANAENPTQVKSVIRLIDKNINNEDDWKLFEEAFNNADKKFLKKTKEKHPGLTANDLRLCAYLRLNLTSKEIAPLLNISIKSVEVKRYRLRKKMNLEHDANLTEYILNI